MGIPIFFCKESSPYIGYLGGFACYIIPDGDIGGGVYWDSCGQ